MIVWITQNIGSGTRSRADRPAVGTAHIVKCALPAIPRGKYKHRRMLQTFPMKITVLILRRNGFMVEWSKQLSSTIPMIYVECRLPTKEDIRK